MDIRYGSQASIFHVRAYAPIPGACLTELLACFFLCLCYSQKCGSRNLLLLLLLLCTLMGFCGELDTGYEFYGLADYLQCS
jgi:hypothetical protein